ncbi:hypothetical protein FACS189413_08690 [Bacteroidia bacterium]|nr:hypothetical protein FACS189463_3290 [Bacteroidia bacterium]GHU69565.1 hypothetical protein FACS189413_08690 [Bacteroidia bacterium]
MSFKTVFIAFIFTTTASVLFAQTKKEHSFSFSSSLLAREYPSPYWHDEDNVRQKEYEALTGDFGYKAVGYDKTSYGTWELEYRFHLTNRIRVNCSLFGGLSTQHWDIYDNPDGSRSANIMDCRFALLPGMDFLIYNWDRTRIYFTAQAGMDWMHRGLKYLEPAERNKVFFAGQVWWHFEHRIEGPIVFNWGMGYGALGLVKLGLAYRF